MANVKDLEKRVDELMRLLEMRGITVPESPRPGEPGPDHVPFGSARHAALLGLVEVDDEETDFTTFTSPGGKVYRLADENEPLRVYPGMDPDKSTRIILRQKVNELEGGAPPVPEGAPPMWVPRDTP